MNFFGLFHTNHKLSDAKGKDRSPPLEEVMNNTKQPIALLKTMQTGENSDSIGYSSLLRNKLEHTKPTANGNDGAIKKAVAGESERCIPVVDAKYEPKHGSLQKEIKSEPTGKDHNGRTDEEQDQYTILEELNIIKSRVSQQAEVIESLQKKFKDLEPKDNTQKLKAVQQLFTDRKEERCALLEKIKKLKHLSEQTQSTKSGFKEDLELLEKKLESLESMSNTTVTLKAVEIALSDEDKPKGLGPRDNMEREDEILVLLEKIHKKKALCQECAEPQPGLVEDLKTLEFTLKGLQLQMHRCTKETKDYHDEPSLLCKTKTSEESEPIPVCPISDFKSQETQTEFSMDAYSALSMRESNIKDQLCFLLERKTKLDGKEAILKQKEEELRLREEELLAGKYPYQDTQYWYSVPQRGEARSHKAYRYNNGEGNKYKFRSVNYIGSVGNGGNRVYHKSSLQ